ncbi:hypothetical protein EJB05_49271, partial [Eragrostis curvula]
MIEICKALGMNTDGVEILWASEEINKQINEYWSLVMDIAQKRSLNRIVRCCQIMGRSEKEALSAAQILYPLMQCADIFFLKVDICQMGMDQRKVNMLAREFCEVIRRNNRPIILNYNKVEELFEDYSSGTLHPDDVKSALAKAINQILQPVRDPFDNNSDAKALFSTVK